MVIQMILRCTLLFTAFGISFSRADAAPQDTAKNHAFHLGVFGGALDIKTDVNREVDKKGALLGLNLARVWNFSEAFASVGAGYLAGSAKGSSAMTMGDQTAKISSAFLDLNAGYHIWSPLSLALGVQSWFGKGGNFSPEDDSEKYKLYAYAEIDFQPNMTQPFALNLRYLRDVNIRDRVVTAITAGINYQLPF